jgi:hypothetical protein
MYINKLSSNNKGETSCNTMDLFIFGLTLLRENFALDRTMARQKMDMSRPLVT